MIASIRFPRFGITTPALLAAVGLLMPALAPAALLRVGPTRTYKTVRAAAQAVQDGDTVEVDAGIYSQDVTAWNRNNITVRGVGGGRPHMRADGAQEGGKGTWVLYGRNFTAENIEFSGSSVPDQNGAGIRADGAGTLVVRNCYFHDNENGILGGGDASSDVLIEYSIFNHNGYGDGQSHNMYIDQVRTFTLRYCYTHRALIGHNVKTRAYENFILYNRIMDEADGEASYEIDIPQGGRSYIIGNLIQKGPYADNSSLVAYAAENTLNGVLDLYVVNNTFVNDRTNGCTFVQMRSGTTARVTNNIFYGPGSLWNSGSTVTPNKNYVEPTYNNSPGFANPATYDYHLTASSPVGTGGIVHAGAAPGTSSTGYDLTPVFQYEYDAQRTPRTAIGAIDIGAYEYSSPTSIDSIAPAAPTDLGAR